MFAFFDSSLQGFASSPVSSPRSVFTVSSRSGTSISVGGRVVALRVCFLCRSSFDGLVYGGGVSHFRRGIHLYPFLHGSGFLCSCCRFSLLLELEALGVIFVSDGSSCFSSSSSGFAVGSLFLFFRYFWCCRRSSERFGCRRDVHCCRRRFLWYESLKARRVCPGACLDATN